MRLIYLGFLLAAALPAFAQNVAPKYDEDGCEALGARLDAAKAAKQKPAGDDEEQFDLCLSFLGCEKSQAQADTVPSEKINTNRKLMHFVNVTCGHLPE